MWEDKYLLFKPHSLGYFVVAALANQYRFPPSSSHCSGLDEVDLPPLEVLLTRKGADRINKKPPASGLKTRGVSVAADSQLQPGQGIWRISGWAREQEPSAHLFTQLSQAA